MTQYTYNGLDETTTVKADILFNAPATGQTGPLPPVQQVTTYTYGVAKGGNISINDNGLLNTVTYGLVPDQPNSGLPQLVNMPADTEMVTGYDNLGEPTLLVTRDGTTHAFVYDTLGRQISDSWTSTASYATPFISNWANQRTTAYDALGRGTTFTMLSGGTVLNQVMDVYDGLGHLVKEYQEHSGPVNTSTSQFVLYTYSTSYSSANNYSRLQILSYPKGTSTTARQINYEYSYSHGAIG